MRYILSLLLVTILAGFTHKFYVSLTQLEYKPDSRSLEVASKLFTDDLEKAVLDFTGEHPKLMSAKQHPQADSLISVYLLNALKVQINGKPVEFNWLGMEVGYDVVWCYLEASDLPKLKKITVENTALMELFDNQTNIITLMKEDEKVSFLFNKAKISETVSF